MIAISSLRERLALQAPDEADDGAGGAAVAWTALADVWAALETLQGGEVFAFGRVDASLTHRVILRHRADVTPDRRFVLGERVFEIRAVIDPDGRRRWLHCLCEEREA